jgi:glycosyltransferase involved in cell wall biosynthesis
MRTWLLHVGEELPVDGAVRRYRYGFLADALQDAGHDVLRWAPTFRHLAKKQRFASDRRVAVGPRYDIQFVHAPGYRRNISLQRVRSYRVLDQRFRQLAQRESRPDVIVSAIPTLEWANAAIDVGRAHRVPVVIDVRDVWPDVYVNALPKVARAGARLLLARQQRLASRACRDATALTAVSRTYLDWALSHAGRDASVHDAVVPLGYERVEVPANTVQQHIAELRGRGVDPARPTCFFAGRLERSYDLATVIDAAKQLLSDGRSEWQFIFCGDGVQLAALQRRAQGMRNIFFLGWVGPAMVQAVASISCVGLCAYAADATQSVPNKPFEYMANGLAVVSSLNGELAELLRRRECGVTYQAGVPTSLSKCLVELQNHPARLERMRAAAFKAWSNDYCSREIYADFAQRLAGIALPLASAA